MGQRVAHLLVVHAAELVTLAGPPGPRAGAAQSQLAIVEDGAVAIGADGRIIAVGPTAHVRDEVTLAPDALVLDAHGRTVLPGFVDPHTHAVFAGDRVAEFEQRLAGADYLAILAAGGGILQTVRATRAASFDDLFTRADHVLDRMLLAGTTALEIKTGYGLNTETELKQLRVIAQLAQQRPQAIVGTLLAAHAVPPEFHGDPDAYVDVVCTETIPAAATLGIARFCDVFCEAGVFSVEQARRVLEVGLRYGLRPKLHAEQKHHLGGAQLAATLGAISADHLEYAEDTDLVAMRDAGVIAVLLPGAAFFLREQRHAPARRMVELGVPVALGTDFNPGSSPIWSMSLAIGLACLEQGLTPAEAIVAATINAAYAIGLGESHGSLEPGKYGNLVILDAPSYRYLPYYFGAPLVDTVVLNGQVVVQEGRLCR
ncbi:imidazolonepropionase [Thermorudis peleae]|uniref:imidazolonepropionase n=1 Tax=Thermorudis peleae TaxID=1382356 RepID=UPI0005711817|nr:imidazolonepropionase [Thermorudis peleae]